MPQLKITIEPFEVPDVVLVRLPGQQETMEVPIESLDAETLAEMIEEFSTAVLAKVSQ